MLLQYRSILETIIRLMNLHLSLLDGEPLSEFFSKRWEGKSSGIKGALKPTQPLRDLFMKAVSRIEEYLIRVNMYVDRYDNLEKKLSEEIVCAYEGHDEVRAKMIANELAEIRRCKNLFINSKIILEKAALRLRTVYEFGDLISAVHSAKEAIEEVRTCISNFAPEMNSELTGIEKILDGIIMEASQNIIGELDSDFGMEDVEVERILEEAEIVAKSKSNGFIQKSSANNRGRR